MLKETIASVRNFGSNQGDKGVTAEQLEYVLSVLQKELEAYLAAQAPSGESSN